MLDLLARLVGNSLVVADTQGDAVRYRFLETVRQYASEHLRAAGEEERMRRRHRDWCLLLAEQAEPHLYTGEQLRWLKRLEQEHDNFRTALTWSHSQSDESVAIARLVRALGWFWYLRGHLTEGRPWLEPAIGAMAPSAPKAGALLALGWLAFGRAELQYAGNLFEQSLACGDGSGDRRTTALAFMSLSFALRDQGDSGHSRPLLDQSLALAREIGFCWCEGFSLYLMGQEAGRRGDIGENTERCAQALPVFLELGERLGLAYTLHDLARVAFERGDRERSTELEREALTLSEELGARRGVCFALARLARNARRGAEYAQASSLLEQALAIWRDLGNAQYIGYTLTALAAVAAQQHQWAHAALLFGAAEAQCGAAGAALSAQDVRVDADYDRAVAMTRAALGDRAFADAWTTGHAMGVDQAIGKALAPLPLVGSFTPSGARSRLDEVEARLSRREREVAILIARGYSNREIAEALVITARTADTHVGHILTKLGLHTRAQIAAWAVQQRLVTGEPISEASDLDGH